jgi:hypothetical protein
MLTVRVLVVSWSPTAQPNSLNLKFESHIWTEIWPPPMAELKYLEWVICMRKASVSPHLSEAYIFFFTLPNQSSNNLRSPADFPLSSPL